MERVAIELVLSDVDGTLLTSEKALTEASVAAVRRLHTAGIRFTVTSSRPPQGLSMLVVPLAPNAPIGAFNGGVFVDNGLHVLEQHPLPADLVQPIIAQLDATGLDAWGYTASQWFVRDLDGPHVQRESTVTNFTPTRTTDLAGALAEGGGAAKIVGVSDDHDAVARAQTELQGAYGAALSATCSQSYYLDVTHPAANKGNVVDALARTLGIAAAAIATIGDAQNDTLMFARSGHSIAMGNASDDVKRCANEVTTSNDDDGFARAVDEFILSSPVI